MSSAAAESKEQKRDFASYLTEYQEIAKRYEDKIKKDQTSVLGWLRNLFGGRYYRGKHARAWIKTVWDGRRENSDHADFIDLIDLVYKIGTPVHCNIWEEIESCDAKKSPDEFWGLFKDYLFEIQKHKTEVKPETLRLLKIAVNRFAQKHKILKRIKEEGDHYIEEDFSLSDSTYYGEGGTFSRKEEKRAIKNTNFSLARVVGIVSAVGGVFVTALVFGGAGMTVVALFSWGNLLWVVPLSICVFSAFYAVYQPSLYKTFNRQRLQSEGQEEASLSWNRILWVAFVVALALLSALAYVALSGSVLAAGGMPLAYAFGGAFEIGTMILYVDKILYGHPSQPHDKKESFSAGDVAKWAIIGVVMCFLIPFVGDLFYHKVFDFLVSYHLSSGFAMAGGFIASGANVGIKLFFAPSAFKKVLDSITDGIASVFCYRQPNSRAGQLLRDVQWSDKAANVTSSTFSVLSSLVTGGARSIFLEHAAVQTVVDFSIPVSTAVVAPIGQSIGAGFGFAQTRPHDSKQPKP